jgi:serine/threonine protein kinase
MCGAIVGTPAFMSPEQAMAEEGMVGPLADVFSLGTVLYYLLAGQTAFSGRSTQEVLNKVRACNPTPPSQIKSNVPHGLEAICLKAMAKLPENRYQGASEFADDLCRWLDDEPISVEKDSLFHKVRRWLSRHRTVSIGIPCVLILSFVLAWFEVLVINKPPVVTSTNVFKHVRTKGSEGVEVWIEHRHTEELLLTCRVIETTSPTQSEERHTIEVRTSMAWDLSKRDSLTFSLLDIHGERKTSLEKFSIRLGQGESYFEYKPSEKTWKEQTPTSWSHFNISLDKRDSWTCEKHGIPKLENIEWIKIQFNADAGRVLIFDNLKFGKE